MQRGWSCEFLCMLPRTSCGIERRKMKKKPSLKAIAVLFIFCAAFAVGYSIYSANSVNNAGGETTVETAAQGTAGAETTVE